MLLQKKLMKKYHIIIIIDDAETFTSEMHDPCTRSRYLQERTTQKYLQRAPVWSRPNTLRRLSQKCFYNSRVLERGQSRVPFYEDVGAFYSGEVLPPFLVEQVSSLQSKSSPCRASLLLTEQVFSLWSKSSPCRASLLLVEQVFENLKLGGQVWAFVLSGPHTKDGLYLLWARGHGPVGLAKPYLIFYPLQLPPSPHLVRRFCVNGQNKQ